MKVMKLGEVEAKENAGKIFRGKVDIQEILATNGSDLRVIVVNFSKGAVNVFHTHAVDQILFVLDGEGIVATEGEEVRVTPGTFIVIPAGEKHWHGATPDSAFSHIAISMRGETRIEG